MEKDKKIINRCSECGLYKTPQTDICPECGGIMDLAIKGEDLSWSCRQCSYSLRQQLKNHAIGITKSLRKNAIHKWKNVLMRKNNLWLRRD